MSIQLRKSVNPIELRFVGDDREVTRPSLWVLRVIFYGIIIDRLLVGLTFLLVRDYGHAAVVFIMAFFFWYVLYLMLQKLASEPTAQPQEAPADEAPAVESVDDAEREPSSREVRCEACASIISHRAVECPECGANPRTGH